MAGPADKGSRRRDDKLIAAVADMASKAWPGGDRAACPALPGCSSAIFVLALSRLHPGRDIVVVATGPDEIESVFSDMRVFMPAGAGDPILLYMPEEGDDAEKSGTRLVAARALFEADHGVVRDGGRVFLAVSSALIAPIPDPEAVEAAGLTIRTGEGRAGESFEKTCETFATIGYRRVPEVVQKGEMAVRGGLVDVWPATSPLPVRIDFFGDDVESIRQFDPASQRSAEGLDEIWVPPISTAALGSATPISKIRKGSLFVLLDHDHLSASVWKDGVPSLEAWEELNRGMEGRSPERIVFTGDPAPAGVPTFALDVVPPPGLGDVEGAIEDIDIRSRERGRLLADAEAKAASGGDVRIILDTAGGVEWLSRELAADTSIVISQGLLSGGCEWPSLGVTILGQSDVYGARKRSLRRRFQTATTSRSGRVERGGDLHPGDYVVHVDHGIGKYLGNTVVNENGREQEVMTIQYADDVKLRIPVSHSHLLSRYIGVSGQRVQLSRIGGRKWRQDCIKAERAIVDYASALLEVQAKRNARPGFSYVVDMPWMAAFEAAFPFAETPDQLKCIEAVKADLSAPRPMDRLICGDAGYGKTEIAMRTAFAVVMNGKQVAVLAPTTVLAEQHFATFQERMAAFPVRIDALSRLRTRQRRDQILSETAKGSIDVLIGTHAILRPGVEFKDLGLVIIDEEQRFGVEHKERLKRLRSMVDVLTLSATPIPRTLYMSMTGARDMSLLQTPPQERQAIETRVERDRDETIRAAVMREIGREGQVFFLHNRVITMELVLARLRSILPGVRIGVAHGQMAPGELASVMRRFEAGEYDLLLCTTIIESGLDIPRANTIIVHRADRFGLADLYQLRGRVGRSSRKGYAYLLVPPQGIMDEDARQRIKALQRHGGLGGGLGLALRDLEIRGAGNILGAEQSGHIASVGFSLYCQLLKRTVMRLKGEEPPPLVDVDLSLDFITLSPSIEDGSASCIPYSYIDDESLRMRMHRRIAEASTVEEVRSLRGELDERFGRMPAETRRYLRLAEMRILAARSGVTRIDVKEGVARIYMRDGQPWILSNGRLPRLSGKNTDAMLTSLFRVVSSIG